MEKLYYSRSKHLTIAISHGELKEIAGQTQRTNEKNAVFSDNGDGFGVLRTSDSDVMAVLDQRIADGGDVFDAATHAKLAIPAETRNVQLERQLEEANRLISELKQGKGASTSKPGPAPTK